MTEDSRHSVWPTNEFSLPNTCKQQEQQGLLALDSRRALCSISSNPFLLVGHQGLDQVWLLGANKSADTSYDRLARANANLGQGFLCTLGCSAAAKAM